MFVTLSCSGLPSEASCTFTPESVEILPTTPASCPANSPASACPPVSSMLLQTVAVSGARVLQPGFPGSAGRPVAWAILLPGMSGARWTGVGCAPAALVAAPGARGTDRHGHRAGNNSVQADLQLLQSRPGAKSRDSFRHIHGHRHSTIHERRFRYHNQHHDGAHSHRRFLTAALQLP